MAKSLQNGNTPNSNVASAQQHLLTNEEILSASVEELVSKLETTPQGISSEQATERLEIYGDRKSVV
jgi:hypothetical protein